MTPFARRIACVFLLALAVRAAHTASIGSAPFARLLVGDGKGYDRWAASIAAGNWIGSETFYQAPLYPYSLAALYTIAGRDPMTVRWAQAFLGAIACVLLALAGRAWLTPRAGLIVGAILALYPPAIYFDGLVQKASLDNLLMCALLAVLGAYAASGRARLLALAGIVLGLFALTRENALVFLFIIAAWLPFHLAGRAVKDKGLSIAVLVAGVALVLLPVGLRNKRVGGDFLVTTSQAGPNFYIGNHEGATGRYLPIRPNRETYEYERVDATGVAEQAAGHPLTPKEVSSYWWSRSFDWIRAHPGRWIALLGGKLMVTWNRAELPDSESVEIYADYSPVLSSLGALIGFGVLVVFAAPGMALARRASPRPNLLYLMLFGFSAAVALFYVFARYRFPMVPILALFGGVTIGALVDAARERKRPRADGWLVGATVTGLVIACLPPVVPAIGSRRLGYLNMGVGFAEAGDHKAAAEAYEKAIALAPGLASPHHNRAIELGALGRKDEELAELETSIRLDPAYAPAEEALGALLIQRGDLEGARRHLLEAQRIDPARSSVPANLGTASLAGGRPDEAAGWYQKAIDLSPSEPKYHYQRSIALSDLKRFGEAEAELEATLRLDPQSAAAHDDLGVLLASRGDLASASRHFLEAHRIDQARVSTLVNLGGIAMSEGRFEDAAGWYRKALAAKPDDAQARANLVTALTRLGRLDEARAPARP